MRWWILALLFLATLINYMDRTIFAVLVPVMRGDLHIDNEIYGKLTAAFLFAYTVGYLIMGRVVDRLGTKSGFAVAAGVISGFLVARAKRGPSPREFSIRDRILRR